MHSDKKKARNLLRAFFLATVACIGIYWRPHGDSNPGTHRERVMS